MNLVEVRNATRVAVDEEAVAALVDRVLQAEGVTAAELGVELVGEKRIRDLNRKFRGKDEVTDVLSFPLEEADEWERDEAAHAEESDEDGWHDDDEAGEAGWAAGEAGPPRLLGDVVICARQALRQARADGIPPAFELAVLLAHGTLHLLGYDHEVDAGQMALRQAEVLELVSWEGLLAASQ